MLPVLGQPEKSQQRSGGLQTLSCDKLRSAVSGSERCRGAIAERYGRWEKRAIAERFWCCQMKGDREG